MPVNEVRNFNDAEIKRSRLINNGRLFLFFLSGDGFFSCLPVCIFVFRQVFHVIDLF